MEVVATANLVPVLGYVFADVAPDLSSIASAFNGSRKTDIPVGHVVNAFSSAFETLAVSAIDELGELVYNSMEVDSRAV